MPKYVVERTVPNAGKLTREELAAFSRNSCDTFDDMEPHVQWLESFVTDHKIYCVYIAPDEATIREHAMRGTFPANSVATVRAILDPTRAEPIG